MSLSVIPPGFKAYDKVHPDQGYTARWAIHPDNTDIDREAQGYILAEDQKSPVKGVLLQKKENGEIHLPEEIRLAALEIAEKHMGFKTIPRTGPFEFFTAHKELLLQGRVSDDVAQYRLTVCTGVNEAGEKVSAQCTMYTGDKDDKRGSGHCKGCGCPEWELAEMSRGGFANKLAPGKAWYPMGCPKGRFSEMPGRRA